MACGSQSKVSSSPRRSARLELGRERVEERLEQRRPDGSISRRRRRPAGSDLRPAARASRRARRPAGRPGPGRRWNGVTVGRVGTSIRARDRTRGSKGERRGALRASVRPPPSSVKRAAAGVTGTGGACSQLTSVRSSDTVRVSAVGDAAAYVVRWRPPVAGSTHSEDLWPSAAWTTRCSARRVARNAISSASPATTSGPVPSANAPRVRTAGTRSRASASPAGRSRCRSPSQRPPPRPPESVAPAVAAGIASKAVASNPVGGRPARLQAGRHATAGPRRRLDALASPSPRPGDAGRRLVPGGPVRHDPDRTSHPRDGHRVRPRHQHRDGRVRRGPSPRTLGRPVRAVATLLQAGRPARSRSIARRPRRRSRTGRPRSRSHRPADPTTGGRQRRLRPGHRDEPGRGRTGWHDRADRDGRSDADRRLDRDRDADERADPDPDPTAEPTATRTPDPDPTRPLPIRPTRPAPTRRHAGTRSDRHAGARSDALNRR